MTARSSAEKTSIWTSILSGAGRHANDAGFDQVRFVHEALPDLDHAKIDLGADFLGRRLKAPLLISAMTGGPARAEAINARLAEAAQHLGIALAVGSQSAALEGEGGTGGLDASLRAGRPTRRFSPISARPS
jgi:isopentenyl-diphosphate delta-isomerase